MLRNVEIVDLMAEGCRDEGVAVWAYCLMPNHVHLIAVPKTEEGLRRAIGEAHRRYTRRVNFREKWRGYLWQGRFASFVMDDPYLLAAARYVELYPVRAKLAEDATKCPWSSAKAHFLGQATAAWFRSLRCWHWSTTGEPSWIVRLQKNNCAICEAIRVLVGRYRPCRRRQGCAS